MSSARSARRFRLVVVLSLALFMALGSFWLNMVIKRSEPGTPSAPSSEPDYHIENFNFVKMSIDGQPSYRIHGTKLSHQPQGDLFHIELPVIQNLDEKKPPQTMRSDTAVVENETNKLHMYGNVHLDRPASPLAKSFHLATEYLLIYMDDDIAQTDRPVTINEGDSTMTGVGMFFNNATRELRLLSHVKVMLAPQQKPAR